MAVTCPALPTPANGTKSVSRNSVGGEATFTCHDGYFLEGSEQLVCQEDGQWTGSVPVCTSSGTGIVVTKSIPGDKRTLMKTRA